jgi:hypothetical protein
MTGEDLCRLIQLPPANIPTLALKGQAQNTRDTHRRVLRLLSEMPMALRRMPLSSAIIENRRRHAPWKWTTALKMHAAAAGALRQFALYRSGAPQLLLHLCPVWKASMTTLAGQARRQLPKQSRPATRAEVQQAIAMEPSLPVRVALILAWAAAGRTGDIQKLTKSTTFLAPNGQVTITYTAGKTVSARGPYSITTAALRPADATLVQRWLDTRHHMLFPQAESFGAAIKVALRRVNPLLECRSLRRGALQAMALNGTPEATLLEFSGHTTTKMLRTYLGWGTLLSGVKLQTAEAGAVL